MLSSFLSTGPDPAAMACNIDDGAPKARKVTRATSVPDLLGVDPEEKRKRANRRKNRVERTSSSSAKRSSSNQSLHRASSDRGLITKSSSGRLGKSSSGRNLRDIRDSCSNNNGSKSNFEWGVSTKSSSSSGRNPPQRDNSKRRVRRDSGSNPLRSGSSRSLGGSSSNLLELGMGAVGAVGGAVGAVAGAVGAVGIGAVQGAVGVAQGGLEVAGVVDNGPTMEDHMTEMEDFLRVVKSSAKEDRNKILTEAILSQAEAGKKAKRAS